MPEHNQLNEDQSHVNAEEIVDGPTVGAAKVKDPNRVNNGGAESSPEAMAAAHDDEYKTLNSSNVNAIKENLLKRDGAAREYSKSPIDAFNRTLRVNDPDVNRDLHDTMQDAEDLLDKKRSTGNNAEASAGGASGGPFKALGKLVSHFKGSTDKSKINDDLRKAPGNVLNRVEESTNYGKEVYLDVSANRIHLQNEAQKLNNTMAKHNVSIDELHLPETLKANPELAIQVRQFDEARESFKESVTKANDFAMYKNEHGSSNSHVDTCSMDTINRINNEIELCKELCSSTIDGEPNPYFDSIINAPKTSVNDSGTLVLDENEGFDNEMMEALNQIMDKFKSMNPFQFVSKRSAAQQPTASPS